MATPKIGKAVKLGNGMYQKICARCRACFDTERKGIRHCWSCRSENAAAARRRR